jgi:hypothetical protein
MWLRGIISYALGQIEHRFFKKNILKKIPWFIKILNQYVF